MNVPNTKEFLELARKDISEIPANEAYASWQELAPASEAAELLRRAAAIVLLLSSKTDEVAELAIGADAKAKSGNENLSKALGLDRGPEANRLTAVAKGIRNQTMVQSSEITVMQQDISGLAAILTNASNKLDHYDASRKIGEERAGECVASQDIFVEQVAAKIQHL